MHWHGRQYFVKANVPGASDHREILGHILRMTEAVEQADFKGTTN